MSLDRMGDSWRVFRRFSQNAIGGEIDAPHLSNVRDCADRLAGGDESTGSRPLPAPPTKKTAARKDEAGQSRACDRAGDGGYPDGGGRYTSTIAESYKDFHLGL